VDLIYFILAAYGMTFMLVYGKIFEDIRPKKDYTKKWNTLWHCPLCVSFHVGWLLVLLSPYTSLWNYEITFANMFLMGCLSAGTSYFLSMVVKDDGIQIKKT